MFFLSVAPVSTDVKCPTASTTTAGFFYTAKAITTTRLRLLRRGLLPPVSGHFTCVDENERICKPYRVCRVWTNSPTIIPAKVSRHFPISNPPTLGFYEFIATTANPETVGSM